MKKVYELKHLECAHCAAKMEERINRLPEITNAVISYPMKRLYVDTMKEDILSSLQEICSRIEPDIELLELDSAAVKIKEAEETARRAQEEAEQAKRNAGYAAGQAKGAKETAENAIDIANDASTRVSSTPATVSSPSSTVTAPAHSGNPVSQSVASANFINGMTTQESCFPYIYYIQLDKIEWTHKNGHVEQFDIIRRWAGTGFMLEDGRFVTSRRIIEQWLFQVNGNLLNEELHPLNKAVCNNERVVAYFTAHASNGSSLTFTSEDFVVDRSADKLTVLRGPLGGLVRGARILIEEHESSLLRKQAERTGHTCKLPNGRG